MAAFVPPSRSVATHVTFNGETIAYAYDARNRVTRIEHKATATGAVQAFYESAWNAQGLRATQRYSQSPGQGCLATYTYDRLGRLTQAVTSHSPTCPTTGNYVYTYDAVGNRLTEYNTLNSPGVSTYAYDANDRLTAITGASPFNTKARTFTYDAAGNVIRQTVPTGSATPPELVTVYRWDAEGWLAGVTTADYREIAYTYDAEGQLVGERVGTEPTAASVTRYLADKNLAWSQILEERDGSGGLKAAYQFAGTQLLKQERGGQAHWSLADHLSTRLLADATGTIANRYVYSPFGEMQAQSGTVENPHLFAGERYDANLGHTYLRARWMNPVLGRFAGMDPHPGSTRNPRSLHDFTYAASDPANGNDPSGRMTMMSVATISLGALTVITFDHVFARSQGRPSVWDAVVATAARVAAGTYRKIKEYSNERHHTIPIYLCGSAAQELSEITWTEHKAIHWGLARVYVNIAAAEEIADKLVPLGARRKGAIMRFAQKDYGRRVIAEMISEFYQESGYASVGSPLIEEVFNREREPYVTGVKTSLPNCVRP